MMRGKPVAVPRVLNKLRVFGTRQGPRTLYTAILRWLHEPTDGASSRR